MVQQHIQNDSDYDYAAETTPTPYQTGLLFERDDAFTPFRTSKGLRFTDHPSNGLYLKNHRLSPLPNRREFVEQLDEPRPFDFILKGNRPAAFKSIANETTLHFPDIPKDYIGTVNNIQDIIDQVNGAQVGWLRDRSGRKVRFGGTYRHRKSDDITRVFQPPTYHLATQPKKSANIVRDPFYQYKPQTMSDINLLATHQFRFAPYHAMGLVPTTDPMKNHKNVINLYQQLINANNNRDQDSNRKNSRAGSQTPKKQKPFSLMLDVYPMPEDESEHTSTTTKRPPPKFRKPYVRHPGMFMHPTKNVIGAINNLPMNMEQQYFQNMNFAQLKPHRYPPDAQNHYENMYFKKFYTNRDNLGPFFPYPRLSATKSEQHGDNKPSQITVHLNLFPKNKQERMGKIKNRNNIEDDLVIEENNTTVTPIPTNVEIVTGNTVNVSGTIKVEDSKRNIQILNPDSVISSSAIWAEKRSSEQETTTASYPPPLSSVANDHVRFEDDVQTFYPTIIPIEPRNSDYSSGESELISDHFDRFNRKNVTI